MAVPSCRGRLNERLVPRYQGVNFSARAAVNPKIRSASCRNDRNLVSAFGARRTFHSGKRQNYFQGRCLTRCWRNKLDAGRVLQNGVRHAPMMPFDRLCKSGTFCDLSGPIHIGCSVFSRGPVASHTDNDTAGGRSPRRRCVSSFSWYGAGPKNPSSPIGRKQGDWQSADHAGSSKRSSAR